MNRLFRDMLEMKSGDWLILLFSLLLVPLAWFQTKTQAAATTAIEITSSESAPAIYSINGNHLINVAGALGDSSIEIRNGKVRFTASPCHSKVCILSGWHQYSGDHVVCVPNKIGVSLLSQQERFDGINF